MTATAVDVSTFSAGTLVIHPCGALDAADAVELRRTLVHVIRHIRPLRLVIDLVDVVTVDAINPGTFAAACDIGADHRVVVFLDHPTADLADLLAAAGVPRYRLRQVGERVSIGLVPAKVAVIGDPGLPALLTGAPRESGRR